MIITLAIRADLQLLTQPLPFLPSHLYCYSCCIWASFLYYLNISIIIVGHLSLSFFVLQTPE